MRRVCNGLYTLGGWIAAFCIATICLLVFIQVLCNLIDRIASLTTGSAIGLTIPSYADFTGFLLAAASFLALAYTLRAGGHIRVSLVTAQIPQEYKRFVEFWCLGVAAAITAYFTWYSALLMLESLEYNDLSSGMIAVPLWIPQLFMVIGLAVLCLALFDDLLAVISGRPLSFDEKKTLADEEAEAAPIKIGSKEVCDV